MKVAIGLKGLAKTVTDNYPIAAAGSRLTLGPQLDCAEDEQQTAEHRGLRLSGSTAEKMIDLPGRFSSTPAHRMRAGIAEVAVVELSDSIFAQSGAAANGAGSRLMTDHANRKSELGQLPLVAVIRNPHAFLLIYCRFGAQAQIWTNNHFYGLS